MKNLNALLITTLSIFSTSLLADTLMLQIAVKDGLHQLQHSWVIERTLKDERNVSADEQYLVVKAFAADGSVVSTQIVSDESGHRSHSHGVAHDAVETDNYLVKIAKPANIERVTVARVTKDKKTNQAKQQGAELLIIERNW